MLTVLDVKLRKGHTYKHLPAAASGSPSQPLIFWQFFPLTKESTTANICKKGEMNSQVQATESVLQVHLSCFATYRNLVNGKD